jgi:ferrous iron transport protein A
MHANPGRLLLCDLDAGQPATIDGVDSTDDAAGVANRLRELGFVPGVRCEIVARMWLSGDPLAVRVGGATFALRRREAARVNVVRGTQRAPVQ